LVNVAEANVQANDGDDDDAVVLSRWNATDKFEGCVIMRCIDTLLKRCDERGFERSAQQLQFHDMFLRACGRVIYKKDWAAHEPEIMKLHNWTRCKSEVAISTPRRFGKTFSVALFVACIALSCPQEICVFSPARRASRKMLERILEFVRLVGGESRLCESNMEQARLRPFNGTGTSLVRSFPSKVSVCASPVSPLHAFLFLVSVFSPAICAHAVAQQRHDTTHHTCRSDAPHRRSRHQGAKAHGQLEVSLECKLDHLHWCLHLRLTQSTHS
jgi:hypothetical protein